MEVITKICTKCGKPKPLDDYWNHPNGKYGKRPRCKDCVRKENAEFEKTYLPKRTEKNSEWYDKNKEAVKEGRKVSGWRWEYKPENKRRHNLKARYGISSDQYDALLASQNGNCAICGYDINDGRRAAVDHSHVTGEVRGIVHMRCNSAIGILKDSPEICRKAAAYLEKSFG